MTSRERVLLLLMPVIIVTLLGTLIPPAEAQSGCIKSFIEIVVSPIVTNSEIRRLELFWDVENFLTGDWVSIHRDRVSSPPLWRKDALVAKGWTATTVMEDRHFREPNFEPLCLNYWAAYWRVNSTIPVVSYCLRTNPRWMEEGRMDIKNLRLKDTFLPGTHDSAAFQVSFEPYKLSRFSKYTFAQDETIVEQLIHGARYLDLRVGHYKGVWWANHGPIKVHPMEHVLNDIKHFMNSTKEILVLDFHNFPVGIENEKTHDKLVSYLRSELGPWAADPRRVGWSSTLGDIWAEGKRLVIAYNDKKAQRKHADFLWTPVSQKWANVRSLEKLKDFFAGFLDGSKRLNYPWSAMAEMTPNAWTVITDKQGGLRMMADTVNKPVTEWFGGDWGGRCNAVAVDFLRSSGVVEAAIRWNKRKGSGVGCFH